MNGLTDDTLVFPGEDIPANSTLLPVLFLMKRTRFGSPVVYYGLLFTTLLLIIFFVANILTYISNPMSNLGKYTYDPHPRHQPT